MGEALKTVGVRSKCDLRDNYTPGWKYNHWELKGVPLRVEFGARDLENNTCVIARRDNRAKETVSIADLPKRCAELCEQIQNEMFERAKKTRDESIVKLTSWGRFHHRARRSQAHLDSMVQHEGKRRARQEEVHGGICGRRGEDAVHSVRTARARGRHQVLHHRRTSQVLGSVGPIVLIRAFHVICS